MYKKDNIHSFLTSSKQIFRSLMMPLQVKPDDATTSEMLLYKWKTKVTNEKQK